MEDRFHYYVQKLDGTLSHKIRNWDRKPLGADEGENMGAVHKREAVGLGCLSGEQHSCFDQWFHCVENGVGEIRCSP